GHRRGARAPVVDQAAAGARQAGPRLVQAEGRVAPHAGAAEGDRLQVQVRAGGVVLPHVVAVDQVRPPGLARLDDQLRVRRAANRVGQWLWPARAEVGVGVIQGLPVGGREVVGHAQFAGRGQLEYRLAEAAAVLLDGEGETVGDRVRPGAHLEGERGGE